MVDNKENYTFYQGVKGLIDPSQNFSYLKMLVFLCLFSKHFRKILGFFFKSFILF